MSKGCINMISYYVNNLLGGKNNEDNLLLSQDNSSLIKSPESVKVAKSDLMLQRTILLKSIDISEQVNEILEEDDNFIINQVKAYFSAFDLTQKESFKINSSEINSQVNSHSNINPVVENIQSLKRDETSHSLKDIES